MRKRHILLWRTHSCVPGRDSSRRLGPFGHPGFGNLRKPLGTGTGARPPRKQRSSLYSKGLAGKVSTEEPVACEPHVFTAAGRGWLGSRCGPPGDRCYQSGTGRSKSPRISKARSYGTASRSFSKNSLTSLRNNPIDPSTAIRFGIAIRPFIVSETVQIVCRLPVAPRYTKRTQAMR